MWPIELSWTAKNCTFGGDGFPEVKKKRGTKAKCFGKDVWYTFQGQSSRSATHLTLTRLSAFVYNSKRRHLHECTTLLPSATRPEKSGWSPSQHIALDGSVYHAQRSLKTVFLFFVKYDIHGLFHINSITIERNWLIKGFLLFSRWWICC